jgi:hypothetical protein
VSLSVSQPDLRSRRTKNGGSAIPISKFFRDPDVKNTSDPWIPGIKLPLNLTHTPRPLPSRREAATTNNRTPASLCVGS